VITVSDGIAERLRRRYRLARTPTVVRNVTALQERGPGGLRMRLGIDADTPLVLHQGAPAPARGCEMLLDALRALPGVQLAFLGDPEPGYAELLRSAVRARDLQDRVTLLASVPLEQLLAHTAEADVGVTLLQDTCENHRLALPNKLFEYIAAGVPVVASALPETRALVEHYRIGWCVTPGDPAALADALELALSRRRDPELRERLDRAAQELSWEREQQRLVQLYALLAAAPSARANFDPGAPRAAFDAATPATFSAPTPARASFDAVPKPLPDAASGARDDKAMRAQERDLRQLTVQPFTRASGQRGDERDRAHGQLPAQHRSQLAEPHQTGVAVGTPHPRLPDRDRPSRGQHPAGLAQRRADVFP
jgi:hypothetical protein